MSPPLAERHDVLFSCICDRLDQIIRMWGGTPPERGNKNLLVDWAGGIQKTAEEIELEQMLLMKKVSGPKGQAKKPSTTAKKKKN